MDADRLKGQLPELMREYEGYKAKGLKLNMSRGKPCPRQLDLSNAMLSDASYLDDEGNDCRNYAIKKGPCVEGIPSVRRLFAEILGVAPESVVVAGNSSLNLMFDVISGCMTHGIEPHEPWCRLPSVKFICPSPGYDRHFAICEHFGIGMVAVPMGAGGPDMDAVEVLAAEDESVKGLWASPKYSNPTGVTYSDATVDRLARMKAKAGDFRIYWDNAYVAHHLYDEGRHKLKCLFKACEEAGNPERPLLFASTSKITHSGGGLSALAAGPGNLRRILRRMSMQTIGPDKTNQLRHVNFLKSAADMEALMGAHADIIRPKFRIVLDALERSLGGLGIATWSDPRGGYFVSLDTAPGCAKRVYELALGCGVTLTKAGDTFPYGKDPNDSNIRISPTFPDEDELRLAMEILCVCVRVAAAERAE